MPLESPGRLLQPNKNHRIAALLFVAAALVWINCNHEGAQASSALLVFAATSMQHPLELIVQEWQLANNFDVRIHYAASSILAKQIENGAPADIFLSANRDWIDHLGQRGQIFEDKTVPIASNRLVIIGRKPTPENEKTDSSFKLRATNILLSEKCVAIGAPEHVPAGMYAMQAINKAGLSLALAKKIIPVKDAQAVAATVLSGACDVGIAYASAQNVSDKLHVLDTFPQSYHSTIEYLGGIISRSNKPNKAERFLNYMRSVRSQEALAVAGFVPIPAKSSHE